MAKNKKTHEKRRVKQTPKNTKSLKVQIPIPIHEQALSLLRECFEAKSINEALRIITNEACVLVGGRGGSIWLRSSEDPDKVVLRWTYRPKGPNKVGESFYVNTMDNEGYYDGLTGWVFATGKPLCLTDITNKNEINRYPHLRWDDKYSGYKQARDKNKQKHFLAVPIFSCRVKKEVIGALRIGASKTTRVFKPTHRQLLEAYAGFISGLLTNYLKREEERALIGRLFTVATHSDLELLLEETAKTIPVVMDGSHCSIFLRNEEGNFVLEATSAPHLQNFVRKNAPKSYLKYKLGEGKTGRVALSGISARVSGNIQSEAGKRADRCECGTTSGAFLAAPIREKEGKPVGVLRVVRSLDVGEEFDMEDERFLDNFGQKLYKCLSNYGCFTKGICFIVMPFENRFDSIYKTIIKPAVEEFDFICMREDEYPSFGLLTQGIISHIANACLIVADITGNNRNVFYELGIAHTLEKTVILLSQTDAPSDIKHWKYIWYEDKAGSANELSKKIKASIKEGLDTGKIRTKKTAKKKPK